MRTPDQLTPAQLAGLARGRAALDRAERVERGLPPEEPCARPDEPRRPGPLFLAAERRLRATGRPPPPPPDRRGRARRGRVTLADVRPAAPDWLPHVDRLVSSGYPASGRSSGQVRDTSVACAWCGVRHRRDWQCEAARNRQGSYSAVVASGGPLT